jgi:hypothetical protein
VFTFTFVNGIGQVGFANTLAASLAQSLGTAGAPTPGGGPTASGGHLSAVVVAFLAQAENFYKQAQAALGAKPPNFTLYGQDIAQMKKALDAAQQAASGGKTKSSKSPSPSPRASGSSSPSPSPSASR